MSRRYAVDLTPGEELCLWYLLNQPGALSASDCIRRAIVEVAVHRGFTALSLAYLSEERQKAGCRRNGRVVVIDTRTAREKKRAKRKKKPVKKAKGKA